MAGPTSLHCYLYVASHGMEDSYRATLIFAAAKTVAEKRVGIVRVALLGEATWLVSTKIQDHFSLGPVSYVAAGKSLKRPQLSGLIADCVKAGVEIGV